jgi:hypothetical protein|tara:strand:+ start:363 stop:602 length:240 start_codon:yes stop_codon:yes gene_type:complete
MSKIKKEELEQLQDQEKKKNAVYHDLGVLDTQRHSLLHLFANIVEEQEKFKKELEENYGKVNINLEDGSYEEIKEDESK